LYITIEPYAMLPLVTLLPSVTSLSVNINGSTAVGVAANVIPPCSLLPQLQVLRLWLGTAAEVPPASFGTLKALTQLRELSIEAGEAPDITDGHLSGVLRCMPRLRTLTLSLDMPRLTLSAPLVVGMACLKLRRLWYPLDVDFAAVLDDVMPAPLFPALEYLYVRKAIPSGDRNLDREDENER
jgi:hypothetical protein